jgi:hypothetical protein
MFGRDERLSANREGLFAISNWQICDKKIIAFVFILKDVLN